MRKLISALLVAVFMITSVLAVGIGTGVGISVDPEDFAPRIWMDPNTRVVLDDYGEPGEVSPGGTELVERVENYAFTGEQIYWEVLVWDKNGIEKLSDVYVRLSPTIGSADFIEANCRETTRTDATDDLNIPFPIFEGEEQLSWNAETMRWYECLLTVEPQWHGEMFAAAVVIDLDGFWDEVAENELWFFNPVIALGLSGGLNFGVVRPGATVLSDTLVLTNNAEAGSGVLLDMYIAGTDFYDPAHSGAACPDSNVLRLANFRYYASSGAYNTCGHPGPGNVLELGAPNPADAECYVGVPYYVDGAGSPGNNNFQRIIDDGGVYVPGNTLSPGADMSLNFKLALPEPCNGGPFTSGEFKFFGEAI